MAPPWRLSGGPPSCTAPSLLYLPVPSRFFRIVSTFSSLPCRCQPPPMTAASPTNGAAPRPGDAALTSAPTYSPSWCAESSREALARDHGRRLSPPPTAVSETDTSPSGHPGPCRPPQRALGELLVLAHHSTLPLSLSLLLPPCTAAATAPWSPPAVIPMTKWSMPQLPRLPSLSST